MISTPRPTADRRSGHPEAGALLTCLSSSEGISTVTIDLTAGRPLATASHRPTAAPAHLPTSGFPSTCPATPGTTRPGWPGTGPSTSAPPPSPNRASPTTSSRLVRLATEHGLRVAPQTTGHNAGPLAQRGLDDVVRGQDCRALAEVTIDPVRRIARVGGGAIWDPAVTAAAAHGLAALHGSSPDVGIAGYSLGGGLGWYGRALGLAANHVTAAEVVIGDGTIVRTDAEHDPELLWALRGGGGNFGVVTALEFSLFDIATAYAGMMIFDIGRAEQVLRRWAAWAVDGAGAR